MIKSCSYLEFTLTFYYQSLLFLFYFLQRPQIYPGLEYVFDENSTRIYISSNKTFKKNEGYSKTSAIACSGKKNTAEVDTGAEMKLFEIDNNRFFRLFAIVDKVQNNQPNGFPKNFRCMTYLDLIILNTYERSLIDVEWKLIGIEVSKDAIISCFM